MIKTHTFGQDENHNIVHVGKRFETEKYTIQATDTYEKIELPDNTVEVVLSSSNSFTFGESNTADGYTVPSVNPFIIHTVAMAEIWVKGTEDQVIQFYYNKL